jgi:hypothetical protein
MNIWTYLFKTVNQSLSQILKMSELEGKSAFCKGIQETL